MGFRALAGGEEVHQVKGLYPGLAIQDECVGLIIADSVLQGNTPSDCRMADCHISLLRVLRLTGVLQATVTSVEFKELNPFETLLYALL